MADLSESEKQRLLRDASLHVDSPYFQSSTLPSGDLELAKRLLTEAAERIDAYDRIDPTQSNPVIQKARSEIVSRSEKSLKS